MAVDGIGQSTASSNITLEMLNGTYNLTIFNNSKYYVKTQNYVITVNGNRISEINGQFNITLTAGTYNLTASLSGYRTYYNSITVAPGQDYVVSINLTKISGSYPVQPPNPLIPTNRGIFGLILESPWISEELLQQ